MTAPDRRHVALEVCSRGTGPRRLAKRVGRLGMTSDLQGDKVWLKVPGSPPQRLLWPIGFEATALPLQIWYEGRLMAQEGDIIEVAGGILPLSDQGEGRKAYAFCIQHTEIKVVRRP